MPHITVQMIAGRSVEQKRRLAKALTEAVTSTLEINPEWVTVVLQETGKDGWAVGGELLLDRFGP